MLTKCDSSKSLDFKYFVNLALMNKLPWDSLVFVLKDLTTTLEKSNEVIEVLVLQGDPNQNFPFPKLVTLKVFTSDPKLVKPKLV